MKRLSFAIVGVLAFGLAACQRQAAPDRAAGSATPSPEVVSTPPAAASPEDTGTSPAEEAAAAAREAEPETAAPASRPRSATRAPEPRRQGAPHREERSVAAEPPAPAEPAESAQRPGPEERSAPRRVVVELPEGTEIPVRLSEPIASDNAVPEQEVVAEIVEAVRHDGRTVLPAGAEVVGHVVSAQRSGRVKGRARLVVGFDQIRTRGHAYRIDATRWDVSAESSRGRDAKIAGGAAAAGAIIGAITGGAKGALKGGAIGGAAGGAAVLITRGNEVELPAGVTRLIVLRQPLRIE